MGERGFKSRFSDEQARAATQLLESLGPAEASRQSGVSGSTLIELAERVQREQALVISKAKRYTREYHEALLKDRALSCLENADPVTKPKETFQLSYAHGNFFRDLNLLQGQPTEIHAHLIDHRIEVMSFAERLARALPGAMSAIPQTTSPSELPPEA